MKVNLKVGDKLLIDTPDAEIVIEANSSYVQEIKSPDTYTTVDVAPHFTTDRKTVYAKPLFHDDGTPDTDHMSVWVRRRSLAPKAKAITPPTEEQRIKHIISELVRMAKEDRKSAYSRPERSKNRAILEGIANALDGMADMIQSGEMFKNMPKDEEG